MAKGFPIKMRARAGAHESMHYREYAWIKGKISTLVLQDFVGATFGAMFFAVTQEVWDIAKALQTINLIAIIAISLIMGFALVYLSRRRRAISVRIEHAASFRAVEIYVISFLTSLLFVVVLSTADTSAEILRQTIVITLPAVVSAATADLLFF